MRRAAVALLTAALMGSAGIPPSVQDSRRGFDKRQRERDEWWNSLTDEQRAEITAKREKDSEEFRARRRAEHEAYVAKSQSKSAKKASGMTGKAFRRAEKKARRLSGGGAK